MTREQFCRYCKYWDSSLDDSYYLGLGRCLRTPEFWNFVEYDKDENRHFIPDAVEFGAFVSDGENYIAKLLTRSYFGCNEWSA